LLKTPMVITSSGLTCPIPLTVTGRLASWLLPRHVCKGDQETGNTYYHYLCRI
jgi:hypothetical protein